MEKSTAIPVPAPVVRRDETVDRLRGYLTRMTREIPNVWKDVDQLRTLRGSDSIPDWEPWCFLPLGGAYAIVSRGGDIDPAQLPKVGILGGLAAWRVTQGIYRYDQTVLDALWETEVTGDIPEQVLQALPEWCVYIETPGKRCQGHDIAGFFCYLEHDANTGRHELRLIADTGADLMGCLPVHLGAGLEAGLDRALAEAKSQAAKHGEQWLTSSAQAMLKTAAEEMADSLAPMVSVVLYLCSANAEMRDRSERRLRPSRPETTKTKDGVRIFPPDQPTTWEVGYRIGAAIRGAMADEARRKDHGGTHATPRAHIRRSHWHSFWTGPKARPGIRGDRKIVLKWLPPIAVNVDDESPVVPTIHKVI